MIDGDEKYSNWTKDYLDAWVDRTEKNNGIIPTNIGLDGTIGGAAGGRWYGGVYGWGVSTIVPQTGLLAHRPYFLHRVHWSFGNGLLLTGDQKYVDTWRGVIDYINDHSKVEDGKTLYPRMHGDEGWYDYQPEPFDNGALQVYYWSMDSRDLERLPKDGWVGFLQGNNPDYPVEAFQKDIGVVRSRMERLQDDLSSPDTRLSDDMNGTNPAAVDALIQLMLGGMPTEHFGHPLHCRFRYFDPSRNRPGMPEDVAALVEGLHDESATLTLVNTNQVSARTVVVNGGAYGEHQITEVSDENGTVSVDDSNFTVHLAPGCGSTLNVSMKRYANRPSFSFPWEK